MTVDLDRTALSDLCLHCLPLSQTQTANTLYGPRHEKTGFLHMRKQRPVFSQRGSYGVRNPGNLPDTALGFLL